MIDHDARPALIYVPKAAELLGPASKMALTGGKTNANSHEVSERRSSRKQLFTRAILWREPESSDILRFRSDSRDGWSVRCPAMPQVHHCHSSVFVALVVSVDNRGTQTPGQARRIFQQGGNPDGA